MNYPKMAAAELLDTYGDRLFCYCWSMLRSREMAQIALRDTLLAARAHIARLTGPGDPGSLGPWLYSLARAECRQQVAVPAAGADEAPGQDGRDDADSRLMAWRAAMSLEAGEFEALELASRHDVDPGLVLGLPAGEALALLGRARQNLERALGAEILVSRGSACPDLAGDLTGVLAGRAGPLTARVRDRVLGHAAFCRLCAGQRPRNVSAARVFALLPAPALSPQARADLLGSCARHQQAAAPLRPPAQAAPVQAAPVQAAQPPVPVARPRAGLLIAGAAGKPAAAGGSGSALAAGARGGPALRASGLGTAGPVPAPGASSVPAGHRSARSRPAAPPPLVGTAGGQGQVLIAAATQPLPPGRGPAAQNGAPARPAGPGPGATPAAPGTLQLSTASVEIGAGSAGRITLTAVGGAVTWSASSSAPNQVSLNSYAGTLQAGQSVTLTVAVMRGAGQGSATLSFEPPAWAPQLVQVSWLAPAAGSGGHWHRRPPPSASPPAPSPPDTASPSPASS